MSLTKDLTENKALIIVGPTAVGKTAVSLRLAKALGGEIVSADSRQVYRYMDIGTAKPTAADLAEIPHHFISTQNPDEYYSAGQYGREARECIDLLQQKGLHPVVVGGSGFYIRALVDGLFAPKISDPGVKEKWRRRIKSDGKEAVFAALAKVDPITANRLHINDSQRIVRALEVYEISGRPISDYRQQEATPALFCPLFVGLELPRKVLHRRIDERVDEMIKAGLVDEVESLRQRGYGPELNALRTVGYAEVFDYLNGSISKAEMVELIKRHTRQYAKRQMTWFRRDKRIHWLSADDKLAEDIADEIIANSLFR
jgi:tRNA dimethylallyltransferase